MNIFERGIILIRALIVILATMTGLVLISCGGGGGGGGGGATPSTVMRVNCPGGSEDVTIIDLQFIPADITVPVNSVVKWKNNGPSTHTVTSTTVPANGTFNSTNIVAVSEVCFQFTEAGVYNYHCTIHPVQMIGSVTVQ